MDNSNPLNLSIAKQDKAKAYQRKKQALSLFHLVVTPLLLGVLVVTPLSQAFKTWAAGVLSLAYGVVGLYFLFLSIYMLLFDFPFAYYGGFTLEHRYELSNQSRAAWFLDFAKKSGLSFLLSLVLVLGLYAVIWNFPNTWWVVAWACYAAVSYVLGRIFPVLIVPLFYKYGPVADEGLKERIRSLAGRYGLPVKNIYSLNLSKTTKKANAAFMGLGRTKRVVLSDTLLDRFNPDEIEAVVAHELGHYKHRDIWRHLGFGLTVSFFGFWLAFRTADSAAARLGYDGAADVSSLPILFLVFYLFSVFLMPLQNGFSRYMERGADRFALRAFGRVEAFITCMRKLAEVNLADPSPHPVYEWFFYNHPSVGKRIRAAQEWKEKEGGAG